MIRFRFNPAGLVMLAATIVVVALGSGVFKLQDQLVMMLVGAMLILSDIGLRLRQRGQPGWLKRPEAGGHLFSVPVWIVGAVLFVINLIVRITGARP